MDKILEFINYKTNNKYKNLLFFDAVLDNKLGTMQINFKKDGEMPVTPQITSELQVLCKQFLGDLVGEVKVAIKSDNITLDEFKNTVKQIVFNCQDITGLDAENIVYNFDKQKTIIKIPVMQNVTENVDDVKNNLQAEIAEKTGKDVEVVFDSVVIDELDILELRKERILEDNKIFEQLQQSQIVNFTVEQNLLNDVSASQGLIAGSDITDSKAVVVGNVKSFVEKIKQNKTDGEEDKEKSKKYYTLELEYDNLVTRCIIFLKKDAEVPFVNVGDSVVVEGAVSEFRGARDIRVQNMALCSFKPPKQVWRSEPSSYRYITPEPYQFFEQSNFFMMQEETKCEYLKNNTFVVYDLETTGISADTNDIIDIGAFKIVNGKIVEKFATFVNPLREIPEEASKINHITNSMVENSPTIEQALPDFYKFCHGCTIIGYNNIGFDDMFIKKAGKKQLYNFDNPRDDVMILAKTYLKGLKNYKLGTVCAEMGVQLIDAHRAVNDALATAKLFIKIAEKFM